MLGILAPNKLFLNSISVFTVYTELETLPVIPVQASNVEFRIVTLSGISTANGPVNAVHPANQRCILVGLAP